MPFARWETFEACKTEMMDTGHDEESAQKICGAIQARAEKGELYKGETNELIIINKEDDLVVGGFCTWELQDPQNDVITTQAQVKFLQRLFKLDPEYQNITVKHGDFKVGKPLLKYVNKKGEEYFSHVNEKGTFLISKIRNDTLKSTQLWRDKIINGELGMYSISGLPIEKRDIIQGSEVVRYVDDLEPWAVTLCEKGINPKAKVSVISKETVEPLEKRVEKRGNQYCVIHCHGPEAGTPIKCFDTEAEAQAMHQAIEANKGLVKDGRPPKDWWDACVARAGSFADDPSAFCGDLWHNGPAEKREAFGKSVGPTPGIKYDVIKITAIPNQIVCVERETEITKAEIEAILQKYGFNKCKKPSSA